MQLITGMFAPTMNTPKYNINEFILFSRLVCDYSLIYEG